MTTTTKSEVEYLARQRWPRASVFRFTVDRSEPRWWAVSDGRQIVGARRTLEELPALIERGKLQS